MEEIVKLSIAMTPHKLPSFYRIKNKKNLKQYIMEKKQILYFEDEKWFANDVFIKIENNTQCIVTSINTPAQFFREIKSDMKYDLFILDIMTPMMIFTDDDIKNQLTNNQVRKLNGGLDVGIVFYEIIREKEKYKETPVIFYTAKPKPQILDNNFVYFSKPAEEIKIINTINLLLK